MCECAFPCFLFGAVILPEEIVVSVSVCLCVCRVPLDFLDRNPGAGDFLRGPGCREGREQASSAQNTQAAIGSVNGFQALLKVNLCVCQACLCVGVLFGHLHSGLVYRETNWVPSILTQTHLCLPQHWANPWLSLFNQVLPVGHLHHNRFKQRHVLPPWVFSNVFQVHLPKIASNEDSHGCFPLFSLRSALLWMDEIHLAPPKKPQHHMIPCTDQQT